MQSLQSLQQRWRREFSGGGLTLLTRGLKYSFQNTTNAKNLRKNRFSPSDGGYSPLALPMHHPWLTTKCSIKANVLFIVDQLLRNLHEILTTEDLI